jgi:hypothetical protein
MSTQVEGVELCAPLSYVHVAKRKHFVSFRYVHAGGCGLLLASSISRGVRFSAPANPMLLRFAVSVAVNVLARIGAELI